MTQVPLGCGGDGWAQNQGQEEAFAGSPRLPRVDCSSPGKWSAMLFCLEAPVS